MAATYDPSKITLAIGRGLIIEDPIAEALEGVVARSVERCQDHDPRPVTKGDLERIREVVRIAADVWDTLHNSAPDEPSSCPTSDDGR